MAVSEVVTGTDMEKMIGVLENILKHRRNNPTAKSDEIFYELLIRYYRNLVEARDKGKYIMGHTVMLPTEIFYAMDLAPLMLELSSNMMTILLNKYEENFRFAAGFGMTPEICSAHRLLLANFCQKALPWPDLLVWSNLVCDNTAKSGDALVELCGCPGLFLDRPYNFSELEIEYFVREVEELIRFIEENTGQKLDPAKLKEAVILSQKVTDLYREIYELRRAIPSPMRNRSLQNIYLVDMMFTGSTEALLFYEALRDEIKERVDDGKGVIPEERYRLLLLFLPPAYDMKLMDWMEREYGAVSVMEPFLCYYGEGQMDPDRPVESIGRKSFYRCLTRQMHGPADKVVEDVVKVSREFKPDGVVYFAHIGCRQACALIRTLKDELLETLDIPTLVVDCDVMDPSMSSGDDLRDRFERFFEILEDRK